MQFVAFASCLATGSSFTSFFSFFFLRQPGDSSRPRRLRSLYFKLPLVNLDPFPGSRSLSQSQIFFPIPVRKQVPQLRTFSPKASPVAERLPSFLLAPASAIMSRQKEHFPRRRRMFVSGSGFIPSSRYHFFFPRPVYLETLSLWREGPSVLYTVPPTLKQGRPLDWDLSIKSHIIKCHSLFFS